MRSSGTLPAFILVVIVVVVFLRAMAASIIPLLAVPVSIIGAFAIMLPLGFTINALSLFGLVLAIGIVVGYDAIVVVENVERHLRMEQNPRKAAHAAMREVAGPVVATTLVLCAVFIPTAFVTGLTGQFYQQFSLTIAIATIISTFNSLTMVGTSDGVYVYIYIYIYIYIYRQAYQSMASPTSQTRAWTQLPA